MPPKDSMLLMAVVGFYLGTLSGTDTCPIYNVSNSLVTFGLLPERLLPLSEFFKRSLSRAFSCFYFSFISFSWSIDLYEKNYCAPSSARFYSSAALGLVRS